MLYARCFDRIEVFFINRAAHHSMLFGEADLRQIFERVLRCASESREPKGEAECKCHEAHDDYLVA